MSTMSLCISSYYLPPPAWINSDGIWSTPVALCFYNFSIASSTSIRLGSGMSGSAVYTLNINWDKTEYLSAEICENPKINGKKILTAQNLNMCAQGSRETDSLIYIFNDES